MIVLLFSVMYLGLTSCTKTDVAEEGYNVQACCGDEGDIPPPPPPPGGNN